MVVLVVLALAALVVLFVVRVVREERKPSEIDRFRAATELTSAWSRGEEPAVFPDEPEVQPTERQGLSRSSRT